MRSQGSAKQLRHLIALQDRERQLLACEIHDGFVQEVVGAQLAIDHLLERGAKVAVHDPEAMENVKALYGEKLVYGHTPLDVHRVPA